MDDPGKKRCEPLGIKERKLATLGSNANLAKMLNPEGNADRGSWAPKILWQWKEQSLKCNVQDVTLANPGKLGWGYPGWVLLIDRCDGCDA